MEAKSRKLKLDLEELEVESFSPSRDAAWNSGTVQARSYWSCWDTDYDCPSAGHTDCTDCSETLCQWCPRPSLRKGGNFPCDSYDVYC
ncbi:MAG TPA: hypothetical protein VFX98_00240 [Longimicrobiaceae bacterium]|nr:hypothetical protein [Longimicrobiaceae bacterium]